MTAIFSKKCELALQAVLFLSIQDTTENYNSGDIARELKVPKEFVSKVLQALTSTGIVGSMKGKSGGFFLAKDPKQIRLISIVEAIDGLGMFEKCILGFPGCSPDSPCPLHHKWGKLRDETFKMLTEETLHDFRMATIQKINNL